MPSSIALGRVRTDSSIPATMFSRSSFTAALLVSASAVLPAQAVTLADAEASYQALQQFYNASIGLWIPYADPMDNNLRPVADNPDQIDRVVELSQLYELDL